MEQKARGRWVATYLMRASQSRKLTTQLGGEDVLQRLLGMVTSNLSFDIRHFHE